LQSYGGLKSQDVEIFLKMRFLKNYLWYNFQNSVPKAYMVTPIDVVVFNFSEIWLKGHGALFSGQKKQNFSCL